ncbi:MAG: hypothetical protein GXC94_01695 [Comamonadaceae bacterium]|nr:hypothetical protein [Comamonadaceae bacterium]
MKSKNHDGSIERDLQAMKAMRRTSAIDYIKWTDDAESLKHKHPAIKRQGHRATMHDLRGRDLVALPLAIQDRPIAELELSIDFYPGRTATRTATPELMADCYEALFRRLAPWKSGLIADRVGTCDGSPLSRQIYNEPEPKRGESGGLLILHRPLEDRVGELRRPTLVAGRLQSETIYYGHKLKESWAHLPTPPEAAAQVKLYCKTTDLGQDLPVSEWRVRVEVTLNRAALAQQGIRRVGHLDQRALTAVAGKFILLGQMTGKELCLPRIARTGRPGGWMAREMNRRERRAQALAIERAATEGMVSTMPNDHLLKFKTDPALMKMVRVPVADFFKQQRRTLSADMQILKIAGQTGRQEARGRK